MKTKFEKLPLKEQLREKQKFYLKRRASRPITPQERKDKIDSILRGFRNYQRESWIFRLFELLGLR